MCWTLHGDAHNIGESSLVGLTRHQLEISIIMATLQRIVQIGRKIIPRGWSPFLRLITRIYSPALSYPAALNNGDSLYLDLSQDMCHGYFYHGELPHERFSTALFERVLSDGDTFVDVGANVGYFSRLACRLVGTSGSVHCIEPLPSALRLLKMNTSEFSNVTIHEIAATNEHGLGRFAVRKHGDTSSLDETTEAQDIISVGLDTLDNVLSDEPRIDVIKIDVEGYEIEVLRGAVGIIQRHHPLLYFEYIHADDRDVDLDDFQSLLGPHGYCLSWINASYPRGTMIGDTESPYVLGIPGNSKWSATIC